MKTPKQRTILIVDDSNFDREIHQRYLQRDSDYHYTFLEAVSGQAGLALCQEILPDVILLDYKLTDLNGLQFLTKLQEQVNGSLPPVIMLTGQGDEAIAVQAIKAGAENYFVKGRITADELKLGVDRAIATAQLRIDLDQSEERLKLAMEAAHIGIWEWNISSNTVVWSDLVGPMFGLPLGRAIENYEAFLQMVHPADRERVAQMIAHSLEIGSNYEIEYRVIWPNDSVHWINARGQAQYDKRSRPLRLIGTVVDITAAKQAEAERLQQIEREQVISQIAQQVNQSHNLAEILQTTVTEVRRFLQTDRVIIFQMHTNSSGTVVTESVAPEWSTILSTRIFDPCFNEHYTEVYRQGRVTTKSDIHNSEIAPCYLELLAQYQVRANLVVPILQGETLWGLIIAHHCTEPRQWQQRDIHWLEQLATQIGNAIQQSALFEQTQLDLAERQRAEEALKQSNQSLADTLESITDAFFTLDKSWRFTYLNPPATQLLKRTQDDLLGKQIWEEFPSCTQTKAYQEIHRAALENVSVCFDEFYPEDGIWCAVRAYPTKDGLAVYCEDISDRVRLEAERLTLQQEQAARAQAEQANRIKDEFLAVLSHELRSPLNPILGWAQFLQTKQLPPEQTREALAAIERNAKLQAKLIEDLLDISRILSCKLTLNAAPVNLVTQIKEALETVRLAAAAKSIQIQTTLDPAVGSVLGDSGRLQQVVWNLLSNAVKFTPAGGRVELRLEKVDAQAQIQVIDTGQGIHPDFLPHVFEYFRQADSSTIRQFGGLGLGLAIVRQIVELHGGTVEAESSGENQGATFTVKLPLLTNQDQTLEDAGNGAPSLFSSTSTPLAGLQVLVVDDEADSRDIISFVLEQHGADVISKNSAQEALQALLEAQPDVLVSDIGMPQTDGYMLIKRIRDLAPEQGGKIPAIALTSYATDRDQQRTLSEGFQQHIAKPVEPRALVDAITKLTREKNSCASKT